MAERRGMSKMLSSVGWMDWEPIPSPYPGVMSLWFAVGRGGWQYVMSFDRKHPGWAASAKTIGENAPFATPRWDLGIFDTRAQAEQAVRRHQRRVAR